MLEIKDYDLVYASQVNKLDEDYWGVCETCKVSEDIKENDIVKLALIDDKVVGILHFKQLGNLIDCYHILVEGKYQKLGIGSALLGCTIKDAQQRNIKTLVAHAVEHDGVVNSKKLFEKYGFVEIYSVKNYWDSLYPGEYCKQCDSNKCKCGVVVLIKTLNK